MRTNTIDFTGDPLLLRSANGSLTVSIPIRIRRYGGRKQVVVPQGISTGWSAVAVPMALQVALARGHRWLRMIESGKATNISAIAKAENVDRSYISRMVNLTTLAPEIQAAILDETLPDSVSLFNLASAQLNTAILSTMPHSQVLAWPMRLTTASHNGIDSAAVKK